jgi:hypothetical protein
MNKLIDAIVDSWDVMTSAPSAHYAAGDGKPHGQCAVTALVVQDYLGGTLLRGTTEHGSHYWNLIPGVGEIDLTRGQFAADLEITRGVEVDRERVTDGERAIAARTAERYTLLAERVKHQLNT